MAKASKPMFGKPAGGKSGGKPMAAKPSGKGRKGC